MEFRGENCEASKKHYLFDLKITVLYDSRSKSGAKVGIFSKIQWKKFGIKRKTKGNN